MIKVLSIITLAVFSISGFAQKQTYDVLTYTAPAGWQKTENEGGIQLSVTDKKSGSYGIAVITKAKPSTATANENFTNDWAKLVKASVQVNAAPQMEQPVTQNGWDIISGAANYTDGANTGIANLLSATGGGQTVSVVLMTNSKQYQNDLLSFLNSLDLALVTSNTTGDQAPVNTNNANGSSVVGLWCSYLLETNGYINGYPQYTTGYLRSEYLFKSDGTYLYRAKNWLVYGAKDILFVYETGTYTVNGKQITLTSKQSKGGWWAKAKSTKEWGSFVKGSDYKPETKTYHFEIKNYSGSNSTALILKTGNTTGAQEYSYTQYAPDKSIIDNPPGLK